MSISTNFGSNRPSGLREEYQNAQIYGG